MTGSAGLQCANLAIIQGTMTASSWGRINASTDLPLKHTRNKLYKKLVLQHLVLQLFDDSRKGSTRFVSTGIRSTKI